MYSDHSWVRDDIYPVISEEENLNQQIVLKENELKILTDNIAKLKIKLSEEKIPSMTQNVFSPAWNDDEIIYNICEEFYNATNCS